jgi:hypothetical protein
MVYIRISRHTPDSCLAGIQNPDRFAFLLKVNPVLEKSSGHNSQVRFVCRSNKQFFFTPYKFYNPSVWIAFDSAFESGFGPKAGEAVQLIKGSLGFHNTQDFTH